MFVFLGIAFSKKKKETKFIEDPMIFNKQDLSTSLEKSRDEFLNPQFSFLQKNIFHNSHEEHFQN